MDEQNLIEVQGVVKQYFEGIYNGDLKKLNSVFHPSAVLFGDINHQPYLKKVDDYLEAVSSRKSPYELNEPFQMEIISIEVLNNVALVKASLKMLGFNYQDYLSINKISGKWVIVNKNFTNTQDSIDREKTA